MNYPGHDEAADPWCFPGGDAAAGDDASSLADMLADYSTNDLFELAWEQGGGPGGAPTKTMQQAESSLWPPPPPFNPPPPPPEVRFVPPSEDEMAAWLRAIVKCEELAFTGDGQEDVAARGSSGASTTTDDTKEKLPITEGMMMGTKHKERRKPAAEESSRRSHHGEAHNLTEKRRRHKINERLRTLQQLVPGCDKSNQASTLDQTIKYMKSLQHHVQEMSGGPSRPAAAALPVVPPQCTPPMVIGPAPTTTMVPFGAMLQMPHYPAAVPVMVPAAAAPLYPVAAPARATVVPEGAASSASHRKGSSSSKGKSSSSRRQKH